MNDKEYIDSLNSCIANAIEDAMQVTVDAISGVLVYYIPRDKDNPTETIDEIWGELDNRTYTNYYSMKVEVDDPVLLQTNVDLFSKFGYMNMDELTLFVSRREFRERLNGDDKSLYSDEEAKANDVLPTVGDLWYVPMVESLFEVTFTEDHEQMIFGKKSFWKCVCKKYDVDVHDKIDIANESGEDPDRAEVVNIINQTISEAQGEIDNINLDKDDPNFDPSSTSSVNDDIENEIDDVKSSDEDSDIFKDW